MKKMKIIIILNINMILPILFIFNCLQTYMIIFSVLLQKKY